MMDIKLNVEADIDLTAIQNQFNSVVYDDVTMMRIHALFAKLIEPWVPMDTGILAHGYEITPQHIKYHGPYAHYMYMGEVYGPNFAQFDDAGNLIGFRSPPKKHPTGRSLIYSTEKHPKASKEWDKAAYPEIKDQFLEGVKAILIRRMQELYGSR